MKSKACRRGTSPVCRASTRESDEGRAARELAAALNDVGTVVCFVSPSYDLAALAKELDAAFPDACVVGCTTSGQISHAGFQPDGISAVGFCADVFKTTSHVIEPLDDMARCVVGVTDEIRQRLDDAHDEAFGLLFVDGLSMAEEQLSAALYAGVGRLPIVGGSAGDDLGFVQTHVLANGEFRSNAAVLLLVETSVPFTTIKVMHHVPTERRLVITSAEPEQRLVREINGFPAAEQYAHMIGVEVADLGPSVFSKHPVMLRIGDEYYIRSIRSVEPDGSMHFYCAIDEGLVLSLARPIRPVDALQHSFDRAAQEIGEPSIVLGCDCILRRLEFEEAGLDDEVGQFFSEKNVVGFSTYGEQVDGVHVNQTFAGIALGGRQ